MRWCMFNSVCQTTACRDDLHGDLYHGRPTTNSFPIISCCTLSVTASFAQAKDGHDAFLFGDKCDRAQDLEASPGADGRRT